MSSEEIYQILTKCIRDVFARRKFGYANVMSNYDINGAFMGFYISEFAVGDYSFRLYGNDLEVEKDGVIIGKCKTEGEIIGWLFQLLEYVISNSHVKDMIRVCNI